MEELESQNQKTAQSVEPIIAPKPSKGPIIIALIGGIILGMVITGILVVVSALNIGKNKAANSQDVLGELKAEDVIDGKHTTKLETLITYINKYYYKDVKADKLVDGIYAGLLESLDDPYSAYYTADEYKDLMESLTGNYAGIGALLQKDKETGIVKITKVYEGTPAKESGLKEGDIIVSADGFEGADEELDKFVQRIRGEAGTDVELAIKRDDEELTITCTRANIVTPTVEHKMLDDKVGLITMSQFTDSTYDDFVAAYEDLEKQGMKAVVFDMRDNGGGLLNSVVEVLDYLLPEGVVVYTEDKQGKRTDYTSEDKTKKDIPIVVLVNENTASAAEIFTGAIRDFERGKIVGTNTFGKGIVQQTIPLVDGSAIKLTTETYYTPSGDCIQDKGIKPNIELEYENLGGEDAEYTEENDNQLQKALELLKAE